jgi:cell division septum initiation protein DivIVA
LIYFQALGEDVLKQIDELYQKITPDDDSDVSVEEQIATASQHLAEFFTASSKEFSGTTCILALTLQMI